MATPSVSLVETLIGAIPFEEGAALVARVGERATITARSGSIEVGSVALTVEAMDDLIAQVLPPDQLESLQENGTVHFPFKPHSISGDFAVLAASTPGDRWLEIRRRSTAGAAATMPGADLPAAPVATIPALVSPAPVTTPAPAPTPAAAVPMANDDDVAQLLSRFQAPESASTLSWDPEPAAFPQSPAFPSSFTAGEQLVESDFDLNIPALSAVEQPLSPQRRTPVLQGASTTDDLTVPAHLDFLKATSEFDREGLTLPETLPPPSTAYETNAWLPDSDSDHIQIGEPAMSGTAASQVPTSAAARQPRRSLVKPLSAVLGFVVLAAVGWFAAERYLSTPSAAVAPPVPAPPSTPPPKAAAANTLSTGAPTTVAAASGAPVSQKPHADAGLPKSGPTPAVAKANAETAVAPKPKSVPPAEPVAAPIIAKSATPAPTAPRDGYAVQVAAVIDRGEADRIVARLVSEGYSGYAIRGEGSAAGYIRVRVGAFKDRETAEEAAARLERSEGVKPWIVKETP